MVPWRWFGAEPEPDWLAELRRALSDLTEALVWVDAAEEVSPYGLWLLEEPLAGVRGALEALGFAVARGGGRRPVVRPSVFGSACTPQQRLDAYDAARGIGVHVEWEREPDSNPAVREVGLLDTDVRYLALARRWRRRRAGFAVAERVAASVLDDPRARKLALRGLLVVGV